MESTRHLGGLGLLPHVGDLPDRHNLDFAPLQATAVDLRRGRLARIFVATGTLVAPLVFAPWSEETFAQPKLIALVIVTVAGLLAASASADRWRGAWVDVPLAVFVVLLVAATFASPDRAGSVAGRFPEYQGVLAMGTYAGVFVIARLVFHGAAILRWMQTVAVAGTAVAAYALVQSVGWDPLWADLENGRTFATIGLPNSLAAYLVLAGSVTAAVARTSQRPAIWLPQLLVQGAALVTTLSRGGLLGAAVAGSVLIMMVRRRDVARPGRRRWKFAAAGIAAAALVIPGVRTTVGDTAARVTSAFSGQNTSVRQHVALWDVAWTATFRDPLVGSGPDLFPLTYAATAGDALDTDQQALFDGFRPESPHNVPLALASGSGLPSMLAYLAFVAMAVVAGLRTWRRSRGLNATILAGLIAAVAGHVTTDMFMTAEVSGSWTFWAILGAIVAVGAADRGTGGSLPEWRGTTSSLSEEGSGVPSVHAASKRS